MANLFFGVSSIRHFSQQSGYIIYSVMLLIVYADILIFLNFTVDFLILKACSLLLKREVRLWRYIIAAFTGSLFSLTIFLPQFAFLIELLIKLVSAAITVIICYGFKGLKVFLRTLISFYTATLLFGGMMLTVKSVFSLEKISVVNGSVYYEISPLVLILTAFIIYLLIIFTKKLFAKNNDTAKKVFFSAEYKGKVKDCFAAVDTGHSLRDPTDGKTVVVADKPFAEALLGKELADSLANDGFDVENIGVPIRLIPVTTVNKTSLKPAVMLDNAYVQNGTEKTVYGKTLCVVFDGVFGADHSALIPPL